jgi:hypothetical protein
MEKLKDIEDIYRKVLIEKLKHPEDWVQYKDAWLSHFEYVRMYCFSEGEKVYFKVSKTRKENFVYVCEDRTFVHVNETIPLTVYTIKISFLDFRIKMLLKNFRFYFKHKDEIDKIESDKKMLKDFLPKEMIRGFKINKIKRKI